MIKSAVIALLAVATWGSAAITTAPRKGSEGNRFLFIVDTSGSMKRLEHAGRQTVFDLIYSGIEGRMQPGDTFGIWTFANDVKAGVFPMQTWTPEKSTELATKVGQFLKEQSSSRGSRLETAITNAEILVKGVKNVDVVIVSSAATRFNPDETWTVLVQKWKGRLEEARKGNKAMIVTLAGRAGQIRQATVALHGERLSLAAPPERRPAPMAKATPPPEAPPKVAREPIIMRGTPKVRPIDEVPTKFSPAPVEAPVIPPIPAPSPVPVTATENPVVVAPSPAAAAVQAEAPAKPEPQQLTVAARQPGVVQQPTAAVPASPISARMLIIAGASLMVIAGIIGAWAFAQARARNRVSYISQSIAGKPPGPA